MKNKIFFGLIIATIVFLNSPPAGAQDNSSVAVRKFELAADVSTNTFDVGQTIVGLGGRLTYNLNSHFAVEAAGYFSRRSVSFVTVMRAKRPKGSSGSRLENVFTNGASSAKRGPEL